MEEGGERKEACCLFLLSLILFGSSYDRKGKLRVILAVLKGRLKDKVWDSIWIVLVEFEEVWRKGEKEEELLS